jgi:probable HAF family extracellular repeat protein
LEGHESLAHDINDRDRVVGASVTHTTQVGGAYAWESGKITNLGSLPGGGESTAKDLNERGEIVGWCPTADERHAVLWTPAKQQPVARSTPSAVAILSIR